ncbi:hypothetical protein DFH09DRAFT_1303215 [Mycena vulgaris]|nr:hypothetical protein DFH09DRAFT_1303215 [Mycena vulgaris]
MPATSKTQRPSQNDPGPPPTYKPVRKYKSEEISLDLLMSRAREVFAANPFNFQLQAAAAILKGEDVIIDVGTGCGKTLSFTLPLLLHPTDISMIVFPLSALMIDQSASAKILTIAVCSETLKQYGAAKVYGDIASGKYQQVIVIPRLR